MIDLNYLESIVKSVDINLTEEDIFNFLKIKELVKSMLLKMSFKLMY